MKNIPLFCQIIGVFTLFFCQTTLALEKTPMVDEAQARYDSLLKNLSTMASDSNNFWQIAMALDPMIEFVFTNKDKVAMEELGQLAHQIFTDKNNQDAWWWDDFGWWGFAFAKLYQYTQNPLYFNHAGICLSKMITAKRAWNDCKCDEKNTETPLFNSDADRGCYNSPLEYPHPDAVQGIQNTVTNAQFLRLATILFKISYDLYQKNNSEDAIARHYWIELTQQYNWFLAWFNEGLLNNTFAGEHHMLIEERVSKYANKAAASNYMKDRFWTGDQGVMLTIFTDLASIYDSLQQKNPLKLENAFLKTSLQYAVDLTKGVQKWLVTSKEDSTILSFMCTRLDDFPFNYESDYKSGPGVFFSNLIHSARNYQPQITKKLLSDGYQIIVDKNYHGAIERSYDIKNTDDFIQVAGDLAAINLAIFQNKLKTPVAASSGPSEPSFVGNFFKMFFYY